MNNTIFISLASYCDDMLEFTLKSAFNSAKNKENIFFGVVDQNHVNSRDTIKSLEFSNQIRYCHIFPDDSLGVSWARHLCFSLYNNEEYFLQVDSHTYFEENNEITFKKPSGKTVLLLRPKKELKIDKENLVLQFRAKHITSSEAILGCHIAAGFLFANGDFIEEIPYDPYLYFHGEEQSLAIRSFTKGWDIYHPKWIPLYHLYKKAGTKYENHHWSGDISKQRDFDWVYLQKRAKDRLQKLIYGKLNSSIYGLGKDRTIDEYIKFSGIDYFNYTITDSI